MMFSASVRTTLKISSFFSRSLTLKRFVYFYHFSATQKESCQVVNSALTQNGKECKQSCSCLRNALYMFLKRCCLTENRRNVFVLANF